MSKVVKNIKSSPIKGKNCLKCTSEFGYREFMANGKKYKGNHNGIDLIGGDAIVATSRGKVVNLRNTIKGYSESYSSGNYVTLEHAKKEYTTYCHLKYGSVNVKKGQIVDKNQEIARMGSTGFSTGKHLHYAVKVNGSYKNPEDYLLGKKSLSSYNAKAKYTGKFPKLPKRGYFTKKDKGEEVKRLQQLLNWTNDSNLSVDGIIGDKTITQVEMFQKKVGIKQDGLFGKDSLSKAKSYMK